MTRALWWLGFVWALPVTLAGYVLADWFRTAGFLTVANGCSIWVATEWFTRVFFQRFGVWAFTWGAVTIVRRDQPLTPDALAHELVHFKQARIFGVFLPLAYGVGALAAMMQGGHPYRDNWLEVWARNESGP